MNRFIFSSDMDGTILNKEHTLSKDTIENIRSLVEKGHIFVLNTGRPYQGMIYFKNQLEIDCPYVCDNGASIYWDSHDDFPVFFTVKKETVKRLFSDLNDIIYCSLVTSHQKLFFQNRSLVPSFIIHIDEDTIIHEGLIKDIVNENILTITIHITKENLETFKKTISKYPSLRTRYWGEYNNICAFDVFSVNANKGLALDYLANYLHIDSFHSLGFGDDLNDLELIEHAGVGVAMKNACEELKAKSDDITFKPHYENGVCDYINKYLQTHQE